MAEQEPIYRKCPLYNGGEGECCGAHHDVKRSRYFDKEIQVTFNDRRKGYTIKAFVLREPVIEYNNWTTYKLEAGELTDLVVKLWPYLTFRTQEAIKHIHSGVFTSPMIPDCPYRR
jgi:hypothetical protein